MSYNYQDAPRESQQEYFGKVNTDNKETLYNALKRIEELEKENAELDMKRKAERQIFQGIVEKKNEQLTKAKEIIKDCIHILKHSGTALDWKTVINKAEQFLKEIEKMKCCRNCRHPITPVDNTCCDCEKYSKWELRR